MGGGISCLLRGVDRGIPRCILGGAWNTHGIEMSELLIRRRGLRECLLLPYGSEPPGMFISRFGWHIDDKEYIFFLGTDLNDNNCRLAYSLNFIHGWLLLI